MSRFIWGPRALWRDVGEGGEGYRWPNICRLLKPENGLFPLKLPRRKSGICDTCKTTCAKANLEFITPEIFFWFSPFSQALFLSNHQSKSVLISCCNLKCSEAERIYKRGYQYKRREPDHIFLRWKKVGVLFFGSSVSFVKSGNAVNCTLHGNASDVDNCFPAHTSHATI